MSGLRGTINTWRSQEYYYLPEHNLTAPTAEV